ncbi:MAG TPA: hypothetical protein VMR54_12845 [Thermoanaerobaculia bacterium]|nr:hypothetical protein [Thermoanaerobaculia bacterium]
MRNRREWIVGSFSALAIPARLLAAPAASGVLEVTYYFLPG